MITLQPTQFNIEKFLEDIDIELGKLRQDGHTYFWICTSSFIYKKIERMKKHPEYITKDGYLKYRGCYIVVEDYILGQYECMVHGSEFPFFPVNPANEEKKIDDIVIELDKQLNIAKKSCDTHRKIDVVMSNFLGLNLIGVKKITNRYEKINFKSCSEIGDYQIEIYA